MAWTLQGSNWAAINWSLCRRIRLREQGGATWYDIGEFLNVRGTARVRTKPGDPSATEIPWAVQYNVSFDWVQSSASELAHLNTTATEGLFANPVELEFLFPGQTIVLGNVTDYPLRLNPGLDFGNDAGATILPCTATNLEPLTSLPSKVS